MCSFLCLEDHALLLCCILAIIAPVILTVCCFVGAPRIITASAKFGDDAPSGVLSISILPAPSCVYTGCDSSIIRRSLLLQFGAIEMILLGSHGLFSTTQR